MKKKRIALVVITGSVNDITVGYHFSISFSFSEYFASLKEYFDVHH